MFCHFMLGYYNHTFGKHDASKLNMDKVAFSMSRSIRVALGHQLFTVYRFRLMTLWIDTVSNWYLLYNMKIHSVLELGRSEKEMHYVAEHTKGVSYFNYTKSITDIKSTDWKLICVAQSEEKQVLLRKHMGPSPKGFKATFFQPKHQETVKNWIFYLPGGAFCMHNPFFPPKLRDTFPDFGIAYVEYSVVPEKCYPSPIIDALDAYTYMLDVMQIDPQNISFLGDSAGGNLCLSTLIKIKEFKLKPPKCVVLISPWSDLTCSGDSFKTSKNVDYLDHDLDVNLLLKGYCNSENNQELLKNKEFSPVFGNLEDLPPILIHSGGSEALLDDNKQLYQKLVAAGNDATHKIYDLMPHVFQIMFYLKESGQSFLAIQSYINKHMAV